MSKRKKRNPSPVPSAEPSLPIRTVALVGHRGAGKTTLAEGLLEAGGAVRVRGAVEHGTTLLDHDPEEKRRRLTLFNGYGWIEWRGTVVQIIDAPGTQARAGERRMAIQAADAVVVVVDAGHELPIGGERALIEAERAGLPCFVFVNKVDRPHDLAGLIESLQVGERPAVCLEAPVSDHGRCEGVVDLIGGVSIPVHPSFEAPSARFVAPFVEALHEAVAVTDDALIAHFLEHSELPQADLETGLRNALAGGKLNAVIFGSALNGNGVTRLLDHLVDRTAHATERRGPQALEYDGTPVRLQGEGGFVAQIVSSHLDEDGLIWKMFRVFRGEAPLNGIWVNGDTGASARVRKLYRLRGPRRATAKYLGPGALLATWDPLPGRPGDTFTTGERLVVSQMDAPSRMMTWAFPYSPELEAGLRHLLEIDGTLGLEVVPLTQSLHLSGLSEAHLRLMLDLLRDRRGIEATPSLPLVIYQEVPVRGVMEVRGEHRVEDGDGLPVEYGACVLDVLVGNEGLVEFEDAFADLDELPKKFRGPIGRGAELGCDHGPLAGYPVRGVRARLIGGDYDMLQSKPEHFEHAARIAVHNALCEGGSRLTEPWWQVDVYVPSAFVGETITEISARRGRVMGMDVLGGETRVVASIPYRDLRTFEGALQGVTGGRGRFFGDFSHFEAAPDAVVSEAIACSPFSTGTSAG